MREIYRIKHRQYTDSDVLAFYMKYRERRIGPFIREVGDFIAHEKRDRGLTLETTAFMFSQIAFFQMYQGDKKAPINPFGPCGWWLKTYFLGKLKEAKPREVIKETGLSMKQAKAEIESWFPPKEPYPTQIECRNLAAFFGMTQLFSKYIRGLSIFSADSVKRELKEIFRLENIPYDEMPHFLVATAIILSGRSCEIVPGFKANITVSIGQKRHIELDAPPVPEGANWKYVRVLPDGNLKVSVSTRNETGDGMIDTVLDLLDTEIDTENYFDRQLVAIDKHGIVGLDLNRNLAFERNSKPMVFPID